MPSKRLNPQEENLLAWLNNNGFKFMDSKDRIEGVVLLTNTILSDPKALSLGFVFDHTYEIQPKAIFSVIDSQGSRSLGIIEISTTAVGLKDVSVLHAYAKMVEPKYALLLCEKSYSKELTYLLTDPNIGPRLMEYSNGRNLRLLDFN